MCSHALSTKLIINREAINSKTRMIHTHLRPCSSEDLTSHHRLVSPIQYLPKCEIWSKSHHLLLSYGVGLNGLKNVFADIYDVTVRVIFDILVVKCDHYFILLDISVKFCQILAYGQEHDFLRS